MLREYLARNPQEYPFPEAQWIGEIWRTTRDKLADSLKQPELRKIPLKSLRNYSGAQYYYKTNDPIGVMRHLRHKKLETAMHYLRALILNGDEEFTCKTAKTPEEAKQLIELGFTYVQTIDSVHLYRKRK